MTVTGNPPPAPPLTINIPATGGAQDGVHTESFNGNATTNVSNTTITNLNPNLPSLGINTVVGNTAATGTASVTLSGTNSITTTNGGGTIANNRGTGAAITTITGTLTVNVLTDNYNMNDGIETTTRGGPATLDMSQVDSATITVRGGNGLFIDSLTGSGNVLANVNSNVTVNLDNTNSGTTFANSGIRGLTAGAGTVTLNTGATVNTLGAQADAISAVSGQGAIRIANSGNLTTAGTPSHGIEATTGGDITVTNSGAIQTSGAGANGIQAATGTGAVSVENSASITSNQAFGVLATATGAGTATVTNQSAGNISGATGVQTVPISPPRRSAIPARSPAPVAMASRCSPARPR